MEQFVPQPWVEELDFSSCETVDKSFVSDHYKETESDLIYKVKVRDENIYIYILIEFQSTAPRFMVVRVLNYITSFYLDYIESQAETKNLRLPVVFPIVLYNGENTWNASTEIADLIEPVPAIGEYGLHFKYLLLDENTYSKEMLLQIRNIVSTLFLAEAHYDIDLLAQELVNLYQREQDKPAVSLLLNWFRQLAEHGRVSPEDYAQLDYVYRSEEEVRTMLAATLERERKHVYDKGEADGFVKGEAAGLALGMQVQRQTILQLLQFRFNLAEVEQKRFIAQLEQIQTLEQLSQLTNGLLNRESKLEDFIGQLTSYLSSNQVA
jgi:predicted transposase/invertase (TIGR01784 family)